MTYDPLADEPGRFQLTANFRFTEHTMERSLPDSALWQSATALCAFRQDYLDVCAGVAASHVVVKKSGIRA